MKLNTAWDYCYRSGWGIGMDNDGQSEADWQAALKIDSQNPYLWLERTSVLLEHKRWKEARFAQAQALKLGEITDPSVLRELAMLNLESGDMDGCRNACRQLVSRFGNSTDNSVFGLVLNTCLLASDLDVELRGLQSIHPQVALKSEDGPSQLLRTTRNAVHFRLGAYEEAARGFAEIEEVDAASNYGVINWFWMAMTQHKLGNSVEAQSWLKRANRRAQEVQTEYKFILSNPTRWPGHKLLYLELLSREANALIVAKGPIE